MSKRLRDQGKTTTSEQKGALAEGKGKIHVVGSSAGSEAGQSPRNLMLLLWGIPLLLVVASVIVQRYT